MTSEGMGLGRRTWRPIPGLQDWARNAESRPNPPARIAPSPKANPAAIAIRFVPARKANEPHVQGKCASP